MKGLRAGGLGLLLAGLVLVLGGLFQWWSGRPTAERLRGAELVRDSILVAADTTRLVLLNDSLQIVVRRVQQSEAERDRLDRTLRWQRQLTAELQVTIEEMRAATESVVVEDSAGVRHAFFEHRSTPVHVTVQAAVPPAPALATADIRVTIAPISLSARIGCGDRVAGVRPATLSLTGPPWADLKIGYSQVSPDVCNPLPARMSPLERLRSSSQAAIGGFVVGAVVALILK
jgi:hypothetical protein